MTDLVKAEKQKGQNALQSLATRLKMSTDGMQNVLMKTVFKECSTNEEFITAVVVANAYGLNPLLKEIYAFPSKGGIIPIVSTDGWTKLMVGHPEYSSHHFVESEEYATMPGAKECPKWMEIHIVKKNGEEVPVREYLDEVFRDLKYNNPWQTHTKRMLRHKTKIQGAREAFGFGGIYEEDEAARIAEMRDVSPGKPGKPVVDMPQALPPASTDQKAAPKGDPGKKINEKQAKLIYTTAKKHGVTVEEVKGMIELNFEAKSALDVTNAQMDEVLKWVKDYSEIKAKGKNNA